MEILCPVCNETPLRGKQRICSSACRSAKYRATQKQDQTGSSSQVRAEQRLPEKIGRKRAAGSKSFAVVRRKSTQVEQPVLTVMEQLLSEMAELHSLMSRVATEPRVDMRTQVTTQAPEGAVGYRLVLPTRSAAIPPKIIPRRQVADSKSWYSLVPFEYPDDLRLRDGSWYRIVWIDSQGNRMRTEASVPVPGLRYIIGPVDTSRNVTQLLAETDRPAPFVLPSSQGTASLQVVTEHFAAPTSSSVASFSNDAPALQAEAQSIGPQAPVQSEAPAVTPVGEQLPAGNERNPFVPTSEPTLTTGSPDAITTQQTPTQKPSLDPFWDGPGKYAKQLESLAQVLYEQRLTAAKEEGRPLPAEPLTQLSRDDRKGIRRAASHPFWQTLGRYLNRRFARAQRKGIGAFASLPIESPSLSDNDKQLMDEVLSSPDKRVYLDYLHARRDALLVGDTLPKEPACTLPSAQRKRLVKLVADVRPIAELLGKSEEE